MNKKISLGLSVSTTILAVLITFVITGVISRNRINEQFAELSKRQELFKKMAEVDSIVRDNYFFYDDIDEVTLSDSTVSGYIVGITDPYSRYYTKEEYKKMRDQNNGNYSGLGITAANGDGVLVVKQVLNGSPAKSVGIRQGDIITSINGESVETIGVADAVNKLYGEIGDKYKLKLLRENQELTVSLEISEYELISVTQEIYADAVGIVKITDFNDKTVEQFDAAMMVLKDSGIGSFVFDLRDNPGGTTESVCTILDKLVGAGDIMTVEYKDGTDKVLFSSDSGEIKGNMAVVVNENTASAAELFTKVMQDYGKAKIIGEKTYGKGVMQNVITLSDGSAVKLTTALYRSPKSENFNGVGINPDVVATLTDAQKENPELSLEEDLQIQTAIKVLEST